MFRVDLGRYMFIHVCRESYQDLWGFWFSFFLAGGDLVCPSLLGGFVSKIHIIPRTTK